MKKPFSWDSIQTKSTSGKQKAFCPECRDRRTDKKDKSLFVNYETGKAHCFYCEAFSYQDSIERKTINQNFKLPIQNWEIHTKLSENCESYLRSRKISQSTILHFGLTEENHYQPALEKEVNNLVFNYFEGEVLINKKYRSADKKFTQTAGTKVIFYNLNSIIGAEEIYIVEGEFDVLAMAEIGIKPVISLPNGANDNDNVWINCEKDLRDVKKFLIATDNDEKGNLVAEKIAQRLGRWRCERVIFEGKDANEDLIAGVLQESIKHRKKYPVSGTFTVDGMFDDIVNLYKSGLPPTIYPKHPCFGDLKDIFSVMRGHLVTCTGIPSHGKSNFTEWYVLNLVNDYKMKASFFSPEHSPMELHQSSFIEKTFGQNFWEDMWGIPRLNTIDLARYCEWANEKIYLTSPENGENPTWDWLFEKFTEQMMTYGVDIFVIDAFNKVEMDMKGDTLKQINNILTRLTSFAQIHNVIIFLIAHPKKMTLNKEGIYEMPSLYDVSGSADFRNQTHDGYGIYRYFEDENGNDNKTVFTNLKTKYKFQGKLAGNVEFNYHLPSGRFYAKGTPEPVFSLIEWGKQFEEVEEVEEYEQSEKVKHTKDGQTELTV